MTDGNFAQRLKEIMKEKKISGKELAEGANTTEATISRYISGKRSPEILEVLKNAAKFLGVSTDYLLGLTNNPFEKGSLPAEVKELRAEKKLTQKEVAEYLRISSVTYLRYEKAQREPSLELLAELAVFFGVSTDYLLGLKEY